MVVIHLPTAGIVSLVPVQHCVGLCLIGNDGPLLLCVCVCAGLTCWQNRPALLEISCSGFDLSSSTDCRHYVKQQKYCKDCET